MNTKEFFAHLAKIVGKKFIVLKDQSKVYKGIRLSTKEKKSNFYGGCFCPITAVCYAETGKHYYPYQYREAASEIDISEQDAILIASAADGCFDDLGKKEKTIRKKLLKVCGLPEDSKND